MYVLFKVFKSMCFVSASSKEFLAEINYAIKSRKLSSLDRKLLKQTRRSLRVIAMRLGPCVSGPAMVGTAMMKLMNYYICVAMW